MNDFDLDLFYLGVFVILGVFMFLLVVFIFRYNLIWEVLE